MEAMRLIGDEPTKLARRRMIPVERANAVCYAGL
jgi:hypothetical protein